MTIAVHLIESAVGVSVRNYGVTGTDNAAVNDTTNFNLAKAALPSTGGILFVPAGTYRLKAFDLDKPILLLLAPGAVLKNFDTSDATTANYVLKVKSPNVTITGGGSIIGPISKTDTPPNCYYGILIERISAGNPYASVRVEGLTIQGFRYGIQNKEAEDHWIVGNTVLDAWDNCIEGPGSGTRCWITDNRIEGSYIGCGIRTGQLSVADACDDLFILNNHLYLCGQKTTARQDGIDVATANSARTKIVGNTVQDCGDGIEAKVDTTGTAFSNLLIAGNTLTSSSADYAVSIRINANTGSAQDQFARVVIDGNSLYHAVGTDKFGVYINPGADMTVTNNSVIGPDYSYYLDTRGSALISRRPVFRGNRGNGKFGIYFAGESGGYIDDLVVADNDLVFTAQGIRVDATNTGWQIRRPLIKGNRLRCNDNTGAAEGMRLSGLDLATISHNDVVTPGECIRIEGALTTGAITITQNTFDSSQTGGDDCIQIVSATGTIEIYDNSLRPLSGSRGWADTGAGATVLAGANSRGVSSAIPTLAGSLGDTFYDSTPAAGATKWVCTTAGGSGAATWTAQ